MFQRTFAADYPNIISISLHPGWVRTDLGGRRAPIELSVSARGILEVIDHSTLEDNGKFLDFQGNELAW